MSIVESHLAPPLFHGLTSENAETWFSAFDKNITFRSVTAEQNMTFIPVLLIACSHRRRGRDKTVLSCLQLRSHRQRDKTRQFCLVRVGGVNKLIAANWKLGRDETKLIETGSKRDKTVLYCLQLCSHPERDKTRQFCLVRVGGVNKLIATNWKLGRDETKLSCRRCE